jgi:cyclic pyranopterin phosphate synthase
MALDRFGRNIHYLRISLTDHCNLRCIYCMPEEMNFRPNQELMQDNEILTLVQVFASLGFNKIRLTGGEPTIRQNLTELVKGIAITPGIQQISMTTNGILLTSMAKDLANAGLQRVNISLDTLDPTKFRELTRWGHLDHIWNGIAAAEQAGLVPIKINSVIARDFNEVDIIPLAALTISKPWQLRFIEMMPLGGSTHFQLNQLVTAIEIQKLLTDHYGPLEIRNGGKLDGEAQLFHIPGAKGEIGIIASVSQPFCPACSRARLTADGKLRLCLLREKEIDLLKPLRLGAKTSEIRQIIIEALWEKPWGHGLAEGAYALNRVMSEIGG